MNLRITAILLITLLIVNLVLFALGRISGALFWLFIIVIGLIAYFVVPKLKK